MKSSNYTTHQLPRNNEQQIRRILRTIEKILKQNGANS
jgi:hypothetical protein